MAMMRSLAGGTALLMLTVGLLALPQVVAAEQQQLRYILDYQREGQAVRPAGPGNTETYSYTLTLSISKDALMHRMPGEDESSWPIWYSAESSSPLTGSLNYTAEITRDRYDADFPQPVNIAYQGVFDAETRAELEGVFSGGVRYPEPHVKLAFDILLQGAVMGLPPQELPAGALMQLSSVAAAPVQPAQGERARLKAEWMFFAQEAARPDDELKAMLYDMEGLALRPVDVTSSALMGGLFGGEFTGQPDADWRFSLEQARDWQEDQDQVRDQISLQLFPVARNLPNPAGQP